MAGDVSARHLEHADPLTSAFHVISPTCQPMRTPFHLTCAGQRILVRGAHIGLLPSSDSEVLSLPDDSRYIYLESRGAELTTNRLKINRLAQELVIPLL